MIALGASGNFSAGDDRFHSAAGATGGAGAEDRVIYNTTTRQFFYDADGSGSGAAQLIGTLQSGATLAAADIVVEGGGQSNEPTEGDDHLVGTAGDDTIDGLGGDDTIEGLGGDDTLRGSDGADELYGGNGNDSLHGGFSENDGADLLVGGDGNDLLDAHNDLHFISASDTLDGRQGNDVFLVDQGDTIIDAGGLDHVIAHDTDWTLGEGLENLTLDNDITESHKTGIGNELDNRIVSTYAGSTMEGRGGNDTLIGNSGNGGNTLLGGDGEDTLAGAERADFLDGGAGNDTLDGNGDIFDEGDVFAFSASPGAANADVVFTFVSARDTIQLDGSVMPALGASGDFMAGDARFAANSSGTAQDSSDRVVYNTTNGQLWYDADGNGASAALLIATLDGAPAVAATDIEVVTGSEAGEHIVGTEAGRQPCWRRRR
jgi:Ca2+-binding RTX toxin-like protein